MQPCACGCGRDIGPEPRLRRGRVVRFISGHTSLGVFPHTFWRQVDRRGEDECWPWLGACNRQGYGQVKVAGKTTLAPKASLMVAGVTVPPGLWVLHKCDNPPCVNPAHLYVGTSRDNIRDRTARNRGTCGEAHRSARLSTTDVIAIRGLNGVISAKKVAKAYGVSDVAICAIWRRRTWKHVTEPQIRTGEAVHVVRAALESTR